mmetsp:Transcript_46555/g.104947  ORF Transcript_46555/g.104947 Transcript_46555/m.104947 type:complete len:229 (-) Transcript_46555:2171-2857(-)
MDDLLDLILSRAWAVFPLTFSVLAHAVAVEDIILALMTSSALHLSPIRVAPTQVVPQFGKRVVPQAKQASPPGVVLAIVSIARFEASVVWCGPCVRRVGKGVVALSTPTRILPTPLLEGSACGQAASGARAALSDYQVSAQGTGGIEKAVVTCGGCIFRRGAWVVTVLIGWYGEGCCFGSIWADKRDCLSARIEHSDVCAEPPEARRVLKDESVWAWGEAVPFAILAE